MFISRQVIRFLPFFHGPERMQKSAEKVQKSADKMQNKCSFWKNGGRADRHQKKGFQRSPDRIRRINQSKSPSETTGVFGIPDRAAGDLGYRQLGV